MTNRNKIIAKSVISLAVLLVSSTLAEQGPSSVKSMREKYEQMIKREKEEADQQKARNDSKPNKMMATKPSTGLSEAERKAISDGRRKTEEEAEASNQDKYKNQATDGLTRTERQMIYESRRKTEEEARKLKAEPSAKSVPHEIGQSNIKSMRDKYEQMIKEKKEEPKEPNRQKLQEPKVSSQEWAPNTEHVRLAGEHMMKLYRDIKRLPTRTEHVKHLEKEMNITEAQAEKILEEMDID
jgi:hypothetical protein